MKRTPFLTVYYNARLNGHTIEQALDIAFEAFPDADI